MNAFEELLDYINRKAGNIGALLAVTFWLVVLFFALKSMLFFH